MTEKLQNQYAPDYVTPPGETLEEILVSIGMSKAELSDRIGKTPKHVGDIIKHGAPITPQTAMDLEKVLGTPASFWNNRERRYRESLARNEEKERLKNEVGWLRRFPLADMIKAGCINRQESKVAQLEELLRYFGVSSPQQWQKLYGSLEPAYRRTRAFESKEEACSAWLRWGELKSREIACEPYDKDRFRKVLSEIRALTRATPETFETQTVYSCSRAGVAVVLVPTFPGAPVYGATRWLTSDKAMIQLSLRGRVEDHFWFTFFHEAGHILLHGKKDIFIERNQGEDEKELEADQFSRNFLIPLGAWQKFLASGNYRSTEAVEKFAAKMDISPAIVVGRLQHEGHLPYSHLNGLRRRLSD